jgi:hypothetical protein
MKILGIGLRWQTLIFEILALAIFVLLNVRRPARMAVLADGFGTVVETQWGFPFVMVISGDAAQYVWSGILLNGLACILLMLFVWCLMELVIFAERCSA